MMMYGQPEQELSELAAMRQQSSISEGFLDQVDECLEQEGDSMTRREVMLTFRLNQLKDYCLKLQEINKQLQDKKYDEEARQNEDQVNEQSLWDLEEALQVLQESVVMIKEQLQQFQSQQATKASSQQIVINRLTRKVNELSEDNKKLAYQMQTLQKALYAQQSHNSELVDGIEELQKVNQELLCDYETSQHYSFNEESFFDHQVQQQMEDMIEQLMKKLKNQKRANKKQNNEIERLNNQVMKLEKMISIKNNKIYDLELKVIQKERSVYQERRRSIGSVRKEQELRDLFKRTQINQEQSKYSTGWSRYKSVPLKSGTERPMAAERDHSPSHTPRMRAVSPTRPQYTPTSYSLIQIIEGQEVLSSKQKLKLSSEVIKVYSKLLSESNYRNLLPEELILTHQSASQQPSFKVTLVGTPSSPSLNNNEETLLYNMAFILESVLGKEMEGAMGLGLHDYIELILSRTHKKQKCDMLTDLAAQLIVKTRR